MADHLFDFLIFDSELCRNRNVGKRDNDQTLTYLEIIHVFSTKDHVYGDFFPSIFSV